MGLGPSRPSASNQDSSSDPRKTSPTYQSTAANKSDKSDKSDGSPKPNSEHSEHSSHGSSKSRRRNAVRYRQPPAAPPGSRRELMLQQQKQKQQQQTLVQEESIQSEGVRSQTFSSRDADLAQEDYVSYSMAEEPGFFASQTRPGTGTRGLALQRTHAIGSSSATIARPGFSGFARRQAQGPAGRNSPQMHVPSAPQPPSQTQQQPSSAPQYLVRPRPAGYTHASRFREEF